MTWLALAKQDMLDEMEMDDECVEEDGEAVLNEKQDQGSRESEGREGKGIKWGSAVNWLGNERVKKTVVEGWVDEKGVPVKSESERIDFEENGRECWKRMEALRVEWEERLREAGCEEM